MAHPAEGSVLDGGFVVGRHLHRGGMANLYEGAHPDRPGEPLVLKLPRLSEGEDPAAIVGFEMEQMILPRLSGPHVPRFVAARDFGSPRPYIAMERLPGPSLAARAPAPSRAPLPVAEVADLAARVADALDDLHRQHVVHLDVNPSNVMLRPSGEAALVDYGLARHDRLPDLMAEEFRLPYGTAPYMAPEQVEGVRGDPRSDLFALGVMMYVLATSRRPFGEPERLSDLRRRLWRDPVPPRRLVPDLPPWFQEVVLRLLSPDPAERHPTAAQLAFDLRHPEAVALTEGRAGRDRRDGPLAVFRRRLAANRRRREAAGLPPPRPGALSGRIADAPIVAVAVDLDQPSPDLAEAMRAAVGRAVAATPGARVACLNVLRTNLLLPDSTTDGSGANRHVGRLVELRHWAAPLRLPPERVTYHVLEAVGPAAAIVEHATANRVDHLVLGARSDTVMRRLLGSVSGEVAARAPCTVTVVRPRGRR